MKLLSIICHENITILGRRAGDTTRIRPDEPAWKGWTISVRGPSVFIASPPGWRNGQPAEGTARQVVQIPLSTCNVEWELAEGERVEDIGVTRAPDVRLDTGVPLDAPRGVKR